MQYVRAMIQAVRGVEASTETSPKLSPPRKYLGRCDVNGAARSASGRSGKEIHGETWEMMENMDGKWMENGNLYGKPGE